MKFQKTALLLLIASHCATAIAEDSKSNIVKNDDFVIIVNKNNEVENISLYEVRKLYLGKSRKFSKGGLVRLASLESLRTHFNVSILRKSNAQFDSIWSRLRFSGRARPPEVFENPAEVLDFVSSTRNAIGFIPSSFSANSVKTVFKSNW